MLVAMSCMLVARCSARVVRSGCGGYNTDLIGKVKSKEIVGVVAWIRNN